MIRFPQLERFVTIAAMTDKSDGDCAQGSPDRDGALQSLGIEPETTHGVRQVHSNNVVLIQSHETNVGEREADGLLTDLVGVALTVGVADCVPVFLVHEDRQFAGLLHAGRKGTYANIVGSAMNLARETWPDLDLARAHALIGPSAGPCCYEVSEELAQEFREAGLPAHGRNLDLWEANRQQLIGAGVPTENITIDGRCTICGQGLHSYRADKTTARNIAIVML